MAVSSRRKLLETVSAVDCIVLGSHFALASVGREKSDGIETSEHREGAAPDTIAFSVNNPGWIISNELLSGL